MIDFYSKGVDEIFISVDSHSAKWAKSRRSGAAVFTKSTSEKTVKYLL